MSNDPKGKVQIEFRQLWMDAFRYSLHGMAISLAENNTILTCNTAFARRSAIQLMK